MVVQAPALGEYGNITPPLLFLYCLCLLPVRQRIRAAGGLFHFSSREEHKKWGKDDYDEDEEQGAETLLPLSAAAHQLSLLLVFVPFLMLSRQLKVYFMSGALM